MWYDRFSDRGWFLSCPLASHARLVVPKIPQQPSVPPPLPLYKNDCRLTRPESTLPQVLIPLHFNSCISNAYAKPQGGAPHANPKVLQPVTPAPRSFRPPCTPHAPLATHHSSLVTLVTPFPVTLTDHPQLNENKTTLSPSFATLTGSVKHKSFVCHSCKKTLGGG